MAAGWFAARGSAEPVDARAALARSGRWIHWGRSRPASPPTRAARATTSGYGSLNSARAAKAEAASRFNRGVCRVRRPTRQAATITIASTAGLSTANTDASSGSCPHCA